MKNSCYWKYNSLRNKQQVAIRKEVFKTRDQSQGFRQEQLIKYVCNVETVIEPKDVLGKITKAYTTIHPFHFPNYE